MLRVASTMYGCETWTMTTKTRKNLEAAEMWFYRRILRIPWTAHQTDVSLLQRMRQERKLICCIEERQLKFWTMLYTSGAQIFRTVTQIKVAIMSCLITPNKIFSHFLLKISFPVIAHNTEQHCGFGSALPQKNRILPPGRRATRGGKMPPPEIIKTLQSNFDICRNFQRIKIKFYVLIIFKKSYWKFSLSCW